MLKRISVIVPVYNTEKYLDECINSIINQTYREWELVLIDDGSNDNSKNICMKYVKKDFRIKYFYQDNSGAGQARQLGVKMATGEFLMFCDSDDYFENNFLEKMIQLISKENSIDIYCATSRCFSEKKVYPSVEVEERFLKNRNDMAEYFFKVGWCMTGKIFKHDIVNGIQFAEKMSPNEDMYNMLTILGKCKNIGTTNFVGYNIRIREDSITRVGTFSEKNMYSVVVAEKVLKDAENYSNKIYKRAAYNLLMLIINATNRCIDEKKVNIYGERLREIFEKYETLEKENIYFRKIDKISFLLFSKNVYLYKTFYKVVYKPVKRYYIEKRK